MKQTSFSPHCDTGMQLSSPYESNFGKYLKISCENSARNSPQGHFIYFHPFCMQKISFFFFARLSINESIFALSQLVIHDKSFPEEVLKRVPSRGEQANRKKKKIKNFFFIYFSFLLLSSADIIKLLLSASPSKWEIKQCCCAPFVTNRGNSDGK